MTYLWDKRFQYSIKKTRNLTELNAISGVQRYQYMTDNIPIRKTTNTRSQETTCTDRNFPLLTPYQFCYEKQQLYFKKICFCRCMSKASASEGCNAVPYVPDIAALQPKTLARKNLTRQKLLQQHCERSAKHTTWPKNSTIIALPLVAIFMKDVTDVSDRL